MRVYYLERYNLLRNFISFFFHKSFIWKIIVIKNSISKVLKLNSTRPI